MANKILQARTTQKIDTSENWAKAINFVPLNGEIIIYSDTKQIKVGDGVTNVNDLEFYSSTGGSGVELLGQTPITLSSDVSTLLLSVSGDCSYTIVTDTLADLTTATITYKNAEKIDYDGYFDIKSTGGSGWYQSYAEISMSGFTVGKTYNLVIDCVDRAWDTSNNITNGYYTIFDSAYNSLSSSSGIQSELYALSFTAATETIIIRMYSGDSASFSSGNSIARINTLYVNRGTSTTHTSITNLSGTFSNSKTLHNICSGATISSTPSCDVYAKSDEAITKSLSGKTIVCFGDSLFGMHRGDTSTPAYIAETTGATVYNVGFGGCRMSTHPSTGYAEFSMWALAKAIHDNDWSSQDSAVSSGVDYFTDQLSLLKSIDFNNVDIAIIHYGTNDFNGGIGIGADSSADSYSTLCGALRYSIEQLLTAYPKLRIYVSVPVFRYWTAEDSTVTYSDSYTNDNSNTLVEFVDALKAVAKEYHLPCIDGYYGLGINKINASTFLSDGTHFNDTGRKRFGTFIGSQLIANM